MTAMSFLRWRSWPAFAGVRAQIRAIFEMWTSIRKLAGNLGIDLATTQVSSSPLRPSNAASGSRRVRDQLGSADAAPRADGGRSDPVEVAVVTT